MIIAHIILLSLVVSAVVMVAIAKALTDKHEEASHNILMVGSFMIFVIVVLSGVISFTFLFF